MKKIMKFYPTIASIMLSIVYTTAIFGMDETNLPYIPKTIWEIIDEFRGENDGLYEQTGHIKSYSRQLDLITGYARKPNEDRSLIRRNITPTSFIVSLLSLPTLKVVSSILPSKITYLLAPIIGLVANHAIASQLANFHLSIKDQKRVAVEGNSILITNCPAVIPKTECRSRSDMRFKSIKASESASRMFRPKPAKRNVLIYELEDCCLYLMARNNHKLGGY